MHKMLVLLLSCALVATVRGQVLEQPAITYGDVEGSITVSVIASAAPGFNGTAQPPKLVVVESQRKQSLELTATLNKSYSKSFGNETYNKTAYFFTLQAAPGVEYVYSFESETDFLGPFSFKIRDFRKTAETRFVVLADFDTSPTALPTFNHLSKLDMSGYDAILHAGDFAYDVDTNAGAMGDTFFNSMKNFVTRVPYLVIAGNHEDFDDSAMFNFRFRMPAWQKRFDNNVYVLLKNGVLFALVNYDYVLKMHKKRTAETVTYLRSLFGKYENHPDVRWRVVISHRPIYCGWTLKKDCTCNFYYLKPFDDIYRKYKVDVFLLAHEHIYERLKFMTDFTLDPHTVGRLVGATVEFRDPASPLTVISGLSGNKEEFPQTALTHNVNDKFFAGVQAYLDVRVTDRTFEVNSVSCIDGSILDSVRLVKSRGVWDEKWVATGLQLLLPALFSLVIVFAFWCTRRLAQKTARRQATPQGGDTSEEQVRLKKPSVYDSYSVGDGATNSML